MTQTALITGASSGIGKEMARIHAEKGGDLVILARSKDELNALKTELETTYGVTVTVLVKDLSKELAPQQIFDAVNKAGIEIDYLINNAGFGGVGKFHERDWDKDRDMIQVNVVALSALTRLFLPDMVARNSGRILNVSSTASVVPGPMQAVYFATKSYVRFLSNAIAEELHDTNVTVTALMPGATQSDFAKTADMEDTKLFSSTASARDVAQTGYDAMMKGELETFAGLDFKTKMTMRLAPLMPKSAVMPKIRKMQGG
ncbi:SDR family NAD(P)-dependent oxidoreductase [Robiginitomaculum antarcticum]|uniref:SDR family NAD(P)-dependent oxidoreductase n=1 Tax=Robiginitomaculum antarcticum TaxID=437507 RepID=UPI0003707E9C|nr:SDR family oxidoreductase [Robiginitomaculum antarcticum]